MNALLLLISVVADLASGRGKNELAEGLKLAGDLVRAGKQGSEEFDKLVAELQEMVDAGRDPTDAEFAAMRTRRSQLSRELRGLGQAQEAPGTTLGAGTEAAGPSPGAGASEATETQDSQADGVPDTEPGPGSAAGAAVGGAAQ